jgi:hypothetical protein
MTSAIALKSERPGTGLAALAEQSAFERHYETVSAAVADFIAAKVHINVTALRHAHADFIDSLQVGSGGAPITHRHFVATCASLIASLAPRRIVDYATVPPHPPDRMVNTVLRYPDEVTALAAGASLYLVRIGQIADRDPCPPLPALVMENAAAQLHRRTDAALRFRELLRLDSPWG